MSDAYQARCLAHLQRKAVMIASEPVPTESSLMDQRRSIRVFQDRPVSEGNEAHCKKYIHNTDWIPQSREIDV